VYFTHYIFCSNVYLATIDFVPSLFFLNYQGIKLSIYSPILCYFDLGTLNNFVNFHGDSRTCCIGEQLSSNVWSSILPEQNSVV
jgi:hypothetical protein